MGPLIRRTTMEPTTTILKFRTILWQRCTQQLLQVGMQILTDLCLYGLSFLYPCMSHITPIPVSTNSKYFPPLGESLLTLSLILSTAFYPLSCCRYALRAEPTAPGATPSPATTVLSSSATATAVLPPSSTTAPPAAAASSPHQLPPDLSADVARREAANRAPAAGRPRRRCTGAQPASRGQHPARPRAPPTSAAAPASASPDAASASATPDAATA